MKSWLMVSMIRSFSSSCYSGSIMLTFVVFVIGITGEPSASVICSNATQGEVESLWSVSQQCRVGRLNSL
jgi:hypothetical protein